MLLCGSQFFRLLLNHVLERKRQGLVHALSSIFAHLRVARHDTPATRLCRTGGAARFGRQIGSSGPLPELLVQLVYLRLEFDRDTLDLVQQVLLEFLLLLSLRHVDKLSHVFSFCLGFVKVYIILFYELLEFFELIEARDQLHITNLLIEYRHVVFFPDLTTAHDFLIEFSVSLMELHVGLLFAESLYSVSILAHIMLVYFYLFVRLVHNFLIFFEYFQAFGHPLLKVNNFLI